MKTYAIKNNFELAKIRTDHERVQYGCKGSELRSQGSNCPFHVYCSINGRQNLEGKSSVGDGERVDFSRFKYKIAWRGKEKALEEQSKRNISDHYFKYKNMANEWASRGEMLTPRATRLLRTNIDKSMKFTESRAGKWEYIVKTNRLQAYRDERVMPSEVRRKPGRPPTERIWRRPEHKRPKQRRSCTLCNMEGHNRRTCKNFVDDKGAEHRPVNPEA
ncbi:hypothetical protein IFM89_009234, partial [Coptis chinensis]